MSLEQCVPESRMLLRYFSREERAQLVDNAMFVLVIKKCNRCPDREFFSIEELKRKISELFTQKPLAPVEIIQDRKGEKESISEVIQYLLSEAEWKMQDEWIHISKISYYLRKGNSKRISPCRTLNLFSGKSEPGK